MNRYLPIVLALALLIVFRVLGAMFPENLPNFQPLMAVFFCGALLARGWKGFAIPLAIWLLTYPLGIGHETGIVAWVKVFLTTLVAFAIVFAIGKSLSKRGMAALIVGSVASTLIFHGITCGMAWALDPRYAKTLTGLWQSLWLGAPGDVIPSWVFLRNLMGANVAFTSLFLLGHLRLPKAKLSAKEGLATSH